MSLKEFATSYKAGYPSHDKMRENADSLLNKSKGSMKQTMSSSAPSREKMRHYAKGGNVEGESRIVHKKTLPLDLHMPKHRHCAGGGAVPMADGGMLPMTSNAIPMKKGGKSHRMAAGGAVPMADGGDFNEMHGLPLNPMPGRLYKKGGSTGMGRKVHRSEETMTPHSNSISLDEFKHKLRGYDKGGAAMGNERATKAPRMVRGDRSDAKGMAEVNMSAAKAPRCVRQSKAEGGTLMTPKFAMGGVGKMRKGEMSKKGMPVKKRGPYTLEETY